MSDSDSCRVKRSKRIAKKEAKLLPLKVTTLTMLGLLQMVTRILEGTWAS